MPTFDQFVKIEELRMKWLEVEAAYRKQMIENEILALDRDKKKMQIQQLKSLVKQAERDLNAAKKAELASKQFVAKINEKGKAVNRLLAGKKLNQPRDEWNAFNYFLGEFAETMPTIAKLDFDSTAVTSDDYYSGLPLPSTKFRNALAYLGWMRDNRIVPKLGSYSQDLLLRSFALLEESADKRVEIIEKKLADVAAGKYDAWRKEVDTILKA